MRSKKAGILVLFVAAAIAAHAQTRVFVPGNASGYFGDPAGPIASFVPAISVSGPARITITYISGEVPFGCGVAGPKGGVCRNDGGQSPLQEAKGIAPHGDIGRVAALIGAFVPQWRVDHVGFQAVDGTKNIARAGIKPSSLLFIGEGVIFDAPAAGTFFLGINDWYVGDNRGGFTVEVTGP